MRILGKDRPPRDPELLFAHMESGKILPYTPKWNEMRDVIGEEWGPLYDGQRTARQAGEAITRRIDPLLAEYKGTR